MSVHNTNFRQRIDNVYSLPNERNNHVSLTHGGGSGGGDDMHQRVKDLEDKLSDIAIDVAILKDKVATKEDIANVKVDFHKGLNNQTWKIISALFIAVLLAVFSHYFIK